MLKHLQVKGFKSIKDSALALRPLNVLIGANGSGKSNCISIFHLINRVVEGRLQLYAGQSGGVDPLLYFGQKVTHEMAVKLDFEENGYAFSLVPTKEHTLIFSDEGYYPQDQGETKEKSVSLGSGQKEACLLDEAQGKPDGTAFQVLEIMKSWKAYHFHDTSDSAKVKQPGNINDNMALRPDASNLAAFLYYLQKVHPQNYQNIVETIRLTAPFFDEFVLRPTPHNNESIQLEWREKDSDAYFNAHSFSDGTLRFICLTTLLLQPGLPSIILLDEPELGLHPYAISLLAALLKKASTKTQVIAATQSVTLVNQLVPEDIVVVDRVEKQSVFKHLAKEDMSHWLDEYGLGDLWEKNIFGGRP